MSLDIGELTDKQVVSVMQQIAYRRWKCMPYDMDYLKMVLEAFVPQDPNTKQEVVAWYEAHDKKCAAILFKKVMNETRNPYYTLTGSGRREYIEEFMSK